MGRGNFEFVVALGPDVVPANAERFARLLLARCGIGPSWVVEIRVRPAVLHRLAPLTTDGRAARFVDEKDLDWFNGVVMDSVVPSFEQYGGSCG